MTAILLLCAPCASRSRQQLRSLAGHSRANAAMGTCDRQLEDWSYPGLDEKVAWWKQYWREH